MNENVDKRVDDIEMSDTMKELNALAEFVRKEGEVKRGHIMQEFGWKPSKASEMASAAADIFEDIYRIGRKLVYRPEAQKVVNPLEFDTGKGLI